MDVTHEQADAWFNGYKYAWENRDTAAALALFTPDVDYREKRFGQGLVGHKDLRPYWQGRVFEHLRDVSYSYKLWGVEGDSCIAFWQASFLWLPINAVMQIDGVSRIKCVPPEQPDAPIKCSLYEEWMEHNEVR